MTRSRAIALRKHCYGRKLVGEPELNSGPFVKRTRLWPILLLLSTACSEAPQFEASMNFDLPNVRPFLLELNSDLQLDLEVEEIVSFVRSVPMEEERDTRIKVTFGGISHTLTLNVYMDDNESPDLYFFAENEGLAVAIRRQMVSFAESRGL